MRWLDNNKRVLEIIRRPWVDLQLHICSICMTGIVLFVEELHDEDLAFSPCI